MALDFGFADAPFAALEFGTGGGGFPFADPEFFVAGESLRSLPLAPLPCGLPVFAQDDDFRTAPPPLSFPFNVLDALAGPSVEPDDNRPATTFGRPAAAWVSSLPSPLSGDQGIAEAVSEQPPVQPPAGEAAGASAPDLVVEAAGKLPAPPTTPKAEVLLRTPRRTSWANHGIAGPGCCDVGSCGACSSAPLMGVTTPEHRRQVSWTPPSGPQQTRIRDEINAAVECQSLHLLMLALIRGHRCSDSHCVFEAVRRQHVPALELLLRSDDQDVNEQCCGRRPLLAAVQACIAVGDVGYRLTEALLAHGADPNLIDDCGFHSGDHSGEGGVALHAAVRRGCTAVASLLLANGADPNMPDRHGMRPLHLLCKRAHHQHESVGIDMLKLLLRYGACPVALDVSGLAAREYAKSPALCTYLAAAENRWGRGALMAVSAQRSGCNGNDGQVDGGNVPWMLPEIFDKISEFF